MIQNVIKRNHKLRILTMNTIIAHPKPKTQEWLRKAMKSTGLKAHRLVEALLEQEAERVLAEEQINKKPAA